MACATGRAICGAAVAVFFLPAGSKAQNSTELVRIQALTPECETANGDEILVCGRRESRSRYRLPEEPDRGFDPGGAVDSVSRERHRLLGPARSGAASCSPVGANGMMGCAALRFNEDIEQYGGDLPNMRNRFRGRPR